MVKRTDTLENEVIYGVVSIMPASDLSDGLGDLEVYNKVYTDAIFANTENDIGVNLENVQFLDKKITLSTSGMPGILPNVGNSTFYYEDSLLKSIDSFGVITIYQPSNTKGDIVVHNGDTQTRLPVGTDQQILIADSTAIGGVKWGTQMQMTIASLIVTLTTNKNVLAIEPVTGSYFLNAYPLIEEGPSAIFFASKSTPEVSLSNLWTIPYLGASPTCFNAGNFSIR